MQADAPELYGGVTNGECRHEEEKPAPELMEVEV